MVVQCIVHSCQQRVVILVVPHLCRHLVVSVLVLFAVLVGVQWLFVVARTCISLMTDDVTHLCILAVHILLFCEVSVYLPNHFLLLFSSLLSCKFWIFWIDVLFRCTYYRCFSPSIAYLFIFLIVFLKNIFNIEIFKYFLLSVSHLRSFSFSPVMEPSCIFYSKFYSFSFYV